MGELTAGWDVGLLAEGIRRGIWMAGVVIDVVGYCKAEPIIYFARDAFLCVFSEVR